jgi:hypothetical protein
MSRWEGQDHAANRDESYPSNASIVLRLTIGYIYFDHDE